ncbi:hypothetical protein HID58_018896 [Brassica napus]|uniref:Uncharacterized protein n=1 Tax=Brassica napus TaxID=3708 RepID=A0ABQ8DB65_BRANA|nr:hypothetical protein HID58_018893 [Brassica napus]KAH0926640.1 hypothetical protein HID58_018896 [Brassica napus]
MEKPIFFLRLIFPVAGSEILSRTIGWYSFKLHLSILPFEYYRLEASLISAIIFLDRLSANLVLFVNRQAPEVSLRRSILFGESVITRLHCSTFRSSASILAEIYQLVKNIISSFRETNTYFSRRAMQIWFSEN